MLQNNKKNFHIGCGYTIGKNWFNYDNSPIALLDRIPILKNINKLNTRKFPKNIKYGNIVNNLLCEESTADNIYCSHVLEHVSLSSGKKMLKNIYKMLKIGGTLRIIVPSLEARIERYIQNKDANSFIKSLNFVNDDKKENFIKKLRFLLGGTRHRWMFDKSSLLNELIDSGFENSKIRECKFGDSDIDVFSEVEEEGRFIESNGELKAVAFNCTK